MTATTGKTEPQPSTRLLDSGRRVSLLQTDAGVRLTLDPSDHWDDVDTIIVLE